MQIKMLFYVNKFARLHDEGGNQYNNWSLRGVRDGMPPVTRHIPDFNTEWKPYNSEEDRRRIYRKWLHERGEQ